jgi:apoptosis-inducing factor 3
MARRCDLFRAPGPYRSRSPSVACFNVFTGDIEDAPAPAAIHSFKTRVSDGKIYVTADEERVSKPNMSRLPNIPSNPDAGLTSGNPGVVIVGGGSGTFHSIISLREVCRSSPRCPEYCSLMRTKHGYIGPITVVSKEPHPPIDRLIRTSFPTSSICLTGIPG